MAYEARELMYNLVIETEKEDEDEYVVFRLKGGDNPVKVYVSCGNTQKHDNTRKPDKSQDCCKCKIGKDGVTMECVDSIGSLRASLKEMLDKLEPIENEFKARQKEKEAEEQAKANEKATVSSAKKGTKPPTKKR